MLQANLKIISSLKDFLFLVSNKAEYRNLFCFSCRDFTRKRKLPFQVLALFIVKLCKRTLSIELEKYFQELQSGLSCSVAAFSLQRMKLNPAFFDSWNKVLWMNFYSEYKNKVKRWRGFRVLGCDGSSISLINRPSLKNYFGGQKNQTSSYIIAKTFYCYDVLNKLVLFPFIAPYRYGEHKMACDFIESGVIEKDMVLIFDRFYSSYIIAALLQFKEVEIKFVIRVNENYNFAKRFIASKKKSAIIDIFPSISSIKNLKLRGYLVKANTPLKVRLVRVNLPNNKTEVLMTNLWEEEGYESIEFKNLYALRWGVESNIDFQKNILQLESISGLTPLAVAQDFYATIFVTNLHFLLIKHAQETINKTMTSYKYPMQVNNNKAVAKIKENIILLFAYNNPMEILKSLHSYFIRSPLPIRKNRSFPRVRKNPRSKSKHRTFTNYKPAY
jgi:hypothetical protein